MAKKKIKNIVWSVNAANDFEQILEYLSENVPEAVDNVHDAIMNTIGSLATGYNHHPDDRLKSNNDGTFKAAIQYTYRISYKVDQVNVNILRIRHTSREPLNY